eukprot:GILI01035855.1.p1 GENE.GILI01035855.1~~GILI01035855.1.p1  ORF type:complete len:226 (-),score=13.27 GILI01035855.1:34-711(-)
MNWLELDKVRNGRSNRMRRKPPDPTIGDHLPQPAPRSNAQGSSPSVNSSSGFSPGQLQQYAASPIEQTSIHGHQSPTESPKQFEAPIYHNRGREEMSQSPSSPGINSHPSGVLPNFNATRNGNGRLSNVISEMRTISHDQQERILTLKGAAMEATHAHGDSLDLLLQEFAGGGRGHQRQYQPVRLAEGYSPQVLPAHATIPEFSGTMAHTTEIIGRGRATDWPRN